MFNWIMKIGILKINRESIITLFNKLLYPSKGRHLKSRDVHVAMKFPKIHYGS